MGCFIQEYHEEQHQQLEYTQVVIVVKYSGWRSSVLFQIT